MKLIGFILLSAGMLFLLLYALYHIVVFLLSGTPWLLRAGVLFVILGFIFLLISALRDKKKKENSSGVKQ